VAGGSGRAPRVADDVLRLVPLFALAVAVVAAGVDPASSLGLVLAAVPVAALGLWVYAPGVPLSLASLAVVVSVVVALRSGELEPLVLELSLLAFIVGRWSRSLTAAVVLGLLVAAAPVVEGVIQDPSEINVGVCILGVAFPWMIGRSLARQAQLAAQLDATRRELAQQALLSERRRIARDVHDLVGHGLAAVLLQVTSARHVLRRDLAAAEEALRSAEELGRRSMQELRRTVSLLRSQDEAVEVAALPSATEIQTLVDQVRTGGLAVELQTQGDLGRISPGVGVALFRIAQEALANATRHAPGARTVLDLQVADGQVRLVAETHGPARAVKVTGPERPGYGLIGMSERAAALGGDLAAGPTPTGWRVSCRLPLEAGDEPANRGARPQ
jgi:signal transduction histidine kinase